MSYFNKVLVMGILNQNSELSYFQDGTSFTSIFITYSER